MVLYDIYRNDRIYRCCIDSPDKALRTAMKVCKKLEGKVEVVEVSNVKYGLADGAEIVKTFWKNY